jgi:hypothetical protein
MRHFLLLLLALLLVVRGETAAVSSVCPAGQCRAGGGTGACPFGANRTTCGCVASQTGSLCSECSSRGFLANGTCVCARPYFDPSAACAPLASYSSQANATAKTARYGCDAWQNTATGFFASTASAEAAHTYGTPNPPVVASCLAPPWGPEPGSFIGPALVVCNTFGGADPNAVAGQNDTAFVTCAGHSDWLVAPAYRCAEPCFTGWALRDTLLFGLDGNTVPVCDVCAPWYGPPVGYTGQSPAAPPPTGGTTYGPFCNVVWTVLNTTGEGAECGGRGKFNGRAGTGGGCTCFTNGTLTTVTGTFGLVKYSNPTGTATALVPSSVAIQTCL